MTRKELTNKVMALGLTYNKAKAAVEAFLDTINVSLQEGQKIKIAGFGTFYVKDKSARRGINPKTGERIQINSKRYPAFKASPELCNKINKN